jgi:hypothetical protein
MMKCHRGKNTLVWAKNTQSQSHTTTLTVQYSNAKNPISEYIYICTYIGEVIGELHQRRAVASANRCLGLLHHGMRLKLALCMMGSMD